MRILVANAGSSTLKLRLVGAAGVVESAHDVDPWDGTASAPVLERLGQLAERVDVVAHRVVHGGSELREAARLDEAVIGRIEQLAPLAPLHQPRAVAAIRAMGAVAGPSVPAFACFDTAFHATLSPVASTYALPAEWRDRWDLRRYGFHGLSHQWATARTAELVGEPVRRLVTCHLGAGASLCAVLDGRSVDTTMGFTPLEGLVMATRSGSVDPGLLLWLMTEAGMAPDDVAEGLERSSGLAGLSGTTGDMRQVMERRAAGDEACALAFAVYVHRLVREVAAMVASLGGLDALAFTGGVGEHVPEVREAVAAGLAHLGVAVDAETNRATMADGDVGAPTSAVRTLVVAAREELEIARQVRAAVGS